MRRLTISLLALLPLTASPQGLPNADMQPDSIALAPDSLRQGLHAPVTDMVTLSPDSMAHMLLEARQGAILRDSLATLSRKVARYEQRLEQRRRIWMALLPSTVRLQYAGSVGLVSLGMGWEYGRRHQWETDFMFGLVPKYDKDDAFLTFTLRQTYVPWTKGLYRSRAHARGQYWYTWQPLSCGLFVNSVMRGDYWTKEPERYPDQDYYRFASKIRLHLFLGQRYTIHLPPERRFLAKEMSLVWEISTCDLYVVSKFVNSTLPLKDILSLSLGMKFKI